VVAEETAKDARVAHILVYYDAQHQSVMRISLISRAKK
jgi:hypothetical protein